MTKTLTPDGLMVLSVLAVAALCTLLWIFARARRHGGVAEVPSWLMFGWDGAAWSPGVIVINRDARNKPALLAHERCHQAQQRRDGLLRFWWRYLTRRQARLAYEVEAYRVWLDVSPGDRWRVLHILVNSYGFGLTTAQAEALLESAFFSQQPKQTTT